MKGVVCLLALALSTTLTATAAAEFVLVTPGEFKAQSRGGEDLRALLEGRRIDPEAPAITIEVPESGAAYPAPVDIVIRFRSADDAAIDLSTLRITYGVLGIDVTERVVEHAEVSVDGIDARGAEMPIGKHRLTVSVADTLGRVGQRRFKFRIVD